MAVVFVFFEDERMNDVPGFIRRKSQLGAVHAFPFIGALQPEELLGVANP